MSCPDQPVNLSLWFLTAVAKESGLSLKGRHSHRLVPSTRAHRPPPPPASFHSPTQDLLQVRQPQNSPPPQHTPGSGRIFNVEWAQGRQPALTNTGISLRSRKRRVQRRQGGGRKADPPPPAPPQSPGRGSGPMTVAEVRVLTLLILCLPMPFAPVPYGSQSDNMPHDYQGGKQAARRLHGCHTEWAELSSPGTSCCEVRQHLPAWRVGEGVPQDQSPACLLLTCLPRQPYCTYSLHSAGGRCTNRRHQLRSYPASSQPPPSRGSWPLPTRTPHRAQLSCLYAEPRAAATDAQG